MICVVPYIIIREKRTANIHRVTIGSHMLAIKGTPADRDTQACCLGPTLRYILIRHFYHGRYIVAIPGVV